MEAHRILKLEIAPVKDVVRDTRKNIKWIALTLAIIISVTLVSAMGATSIENGFVITGLVEQNLPVDKPKAAPAVAQQLTTLDFPTALYFTVVNMTTVGFGDIFPVKPEARALAIFNAIFGLITFAAFVSIIMMALSPSSGGTASLELSDADQSLPPEESREKNKQDSPPENEARMKERAKLVNALYYRDIALETLISRVTEICEKIEAVRPGEDRVFPAAEIADLHAELEELRQRASRLVDKIAVYDALDRYFSKILPALEKERLPKI